MTENLEEKTNKEKITLISDRKLSKYFAKCGAIGGVTSIIGYCVENSFGGNGRAGMVVGFSLGTIIGMFYYGKFHEDI